MKAVNELYRRRGLHASIQAREITWICDVLEIVLKSLKKPGSCRIALLLFNEIFGIRIYCRILLSTVDCHSDKLLSNETSIALLVKIRNAIYDELSLQSKSVVTLGSICSLVL
jgi:hypothetical protein